VYWTSSTDWKKGETFLVIWRCCSALELSEGGVPVDALLLEELGDGVDVDEVDDGEDELGLAAGDAFAVGEELAAFVLDVFLELRGVGGTRVKGE
jgi:hypothetical protein